MNKDKLNNKSILLSIIIPCYNTEKFIVECIKSVTEIKNNFIEIIIINDGSTDNSFKIIKNYIFKKKLSNYIKLISQKNHGLGYSRNVGIKKARGKYITFLDSDDLFIEKFIPKIVSFIKKNNYDIIEYGFFRFFCSKNNKLKKYKSLYKYEGRYLIKDILLDIFSKTVWYASIRIYDKKLWKNIKFPNNFYYEDQMTIYKIFLKAKSIFFFKKPFLGYRISKSSITENIKSKHINDLIDFYFSLKNKNIYFKIMKLRIARTISYMRYKLNERIFDYKKIKKEISLMNLDLKIIIKLRLPDTFYYLFPNFYDLINQLRIKK